MLESLTTMALHRLGKVEQNEQNSRIRTPHFICFNLGKRALGNFLRQPSLPQNTIYCKPNPAVPTPQQKQCLNGRNCSDPTGVKP